MATTALAVTRTRTRATTLGSRISSAALRIGLVATIGAVVAVGSAPQTANAASFDRRIGNPHVIRCLGDVYGITPSVRITQPYVFGNSTRWETIRWMPYLQRWVPGRGWQHVLRSSNWISFLANNQGPSWYQYTNNPHVFVFSNLSRGYYYRVIHVVQWANGELGTMPSDYYKASGHCLL